VVAIDLKNARVAGVAQAGRARGYLREYKVRLSGRTRDCCQNLCCGSLLLTGFRKLSLKLLKRSATNLIDFGRHGPYPIDDAEPNAILRQEVAIRNGSRGVGLMRKAMSAND
jgi:hypothetical protein